MSDLNGDQMSEFKEAFELFDKDGDGKVTARELGIVMHSLGHSATDQDLIDMVNQIDEDGNGSIELAEFVKMMSQKVQLWEEENELKEAFRVFDQDNDGFISVFELRYVMANLGESLSDQELIEMIEEADLDGDGKINFTAAVTATNYNAAMDYWRQISHSLDYRQYASLKKVVGLYEEKSKTELESHIAKWAKQNGLEEEFQIFTSMQKEFREIAANRTVLFSDEMSKVISALASINDNQSISFLEACRRQNEYIQNIDSDLVRRLGLLNLENEWCG